MRKLLPLLLLIFTVTQIQAQYKVSGILMDTSAAMPVKKASVVAYKKQDSIIHTYTRSDNNGNFTLNIKDTGTYILLYAHPKFADISDELIVDGKKTTITKGQIDFTSRTKMLKEAIVRARGSIKMKGDTLVYLADSFKVSEGANVEELLMQLPGIEVDKDGNIKAQGQKVQKVLVDGDEFFGDDPTIATKNLDAKIVEKVEVFDKKSDQAAFTGFDDGEKTKTINLKLKKGMNKGTFGKAEAASDAKDRWNNKLMFNNFKDRRKISGYGVMASTYDVELNWQDEQNYGSNEGMQMDEESGFMYRTRYDDGEDGGSANEGLPKIGQGSLNYSNKWLDDKLTLNLSGSHKQRNTIRNNSANSTTFYGTDVIFNPGAENINALKQQSSSTGRTEWKIDSNNTIKLVFDGNITHLEKNTTSSSKNIRNYTDTTSSTQQNSTANTNKSAFNTTLTYLHKLKKKGRTISVSEQINLGGKTGRNTIYANNSFFGNTQIQDQQSKIEANNSSSKTRVVYTEPLKKDKILLETNYSFNITTNQQELNTYIQNTNNEYSLRVDSLSNTFNSNFTTHRGGVKFRFQRKKATFSIGSDIATTHFLQENLITGTNFDYTRFNVFPTMGLQYKITQNSNLFINYSGNTQQPTLSQLQPISNITDPLNVYRGNPLLKQSFSQTLNVNFWDYKMIKERSLWAGCYFSNAFNNITTVNSYDFTTGRNIFTYENLNGLFNGSWWAGFSKKVGKGFRLETNISGDIGRSPYKSNGIKRMRNNFGISITPGINYAIESKLNISVRADYNPTFNKIDTQKVQYTNFTPSLDIKYAPTKRIKLSTEINHTLQTKAPPFNTNFNQTIWNAMASYKILKKQDILATFQIHDILAQNRGYSRYYDNNNVYELNNLSLKRYALVGMMWKFNKSNKAKKEGEDGTDDLFIEF